MFRWSRVGTEEDGEDIAGNETSSMNRTPGSPTAASDNDQLFPTMSFNTRMQGFVLFAALGLFANFMSWIALGLGNYTKYSVLMTMGNIMSLGATTLLMGPKRQCTAMFDDSRRIATCVYIGSMILTFLAAFVAKSAVLCAMCCVAQYLAFIWYCLSYIPYGRDMARSCLGSCSRVIISV